MNPAHAAELRKLARAYRTSVNTARSGQMAPLPAAGFVLFHDLVAVAWSAQPDPHDWMPGIYAVPVYGNVMRATGGDAVRGAEKWEPQLT